MRLCFAFVVGVVACAPHASSPCPPSVSSSSPAGAPAGVSDAAVDQDVTFDPAMTPVERTAVENAQREAVADFNAFFGAGSTTKVPHVVACKTDACALKFSGPTRRSRAILKPRPTVVINGLGPMFKGTLVHEMVHVEIARRMATATGTQAVLPTWFDEGVATFIGDNAGDCSSVPRAIDDLRRLDTQRAWEGFTNQPGGKIERAYCQARAEIAKWVEKHDGGRAALRGVIDRVARGEALFDDAYGLPLATAIAESAFDRSLDGSFPLDENTGVNAVDQTGRSHVATLMSGPIWSAGHAGANVPGKSVGVKVMSGSFVRADGFVDLGIPDAPMSIALWVKPLSANAKVIIHSSGEARGAGGWCIPLLGNDNAGHLVAQIPFEMNPKSFLTAVGPALAVNTWSHVVVMWSAEEGVRLYVNGALAASAKPRAPKERHRDAPGTPMNLFFGSSNQTQCWTDKIESGDWNGVLDELRIYNYALTPKEIASEMNAK